MNRSRGTLTCRIAGGVLLATISIWACARRTPEPGGNGARPPGPPPASMAGASRPRCRAAELAHLRARLRRAALQSARPDQRPPTSAGSAWHGTGDRHRARPGGDAARRRRRIYVTTAWSMVKALDAAHRARVWQYDPRCRKRRARRRLLRRGQPRRRAVETARSTSARSTGGWSRSTPRPARAGLVRCRPRSRAPLHHHRRAAGGQRQGDHRQRRRRVRRARLCHRL